MTVTAIPESPLTYAQELMDELERWNPGRVVGPQSVLSAAYRISGDVDVAVLRAALDDVVARHGALRTVVVTDGTRSYQQVQPPMPAVLTVTALHSDDTPDRFLAAISRLAHPVNALPRLWAYLGQYPQGGALLVLVAHRVAADEWSMSVLARDLAAAYTRRMRGAAPLEADVMQYVDIAADDHSEQWRARVDRLVPYWQERLRGIAQLALPTVPPRPSANGQPKTTVDRTTNPGTAVTTFSVDGELWQGVAQLARRQRTTPFTVLLTAFVAEFFAGANAALVPVLTPGRIPSEWGTVGCLFNMLAMRLDLTDEPSGEKLLRRVDTTCREAYVNDIPLMPVLRDTPELAAALTARDRVLPFFQYVPPPPLRPLVDDSALDLVPLPDAPLVMPLLPTALLWRFSGAGPVTGHACYDPALFDGGWVADRVNGYLYLLGQLVGGRS